MMNQIRTVAKVTRNLGLLSPVRTVMTGYKPSIFTPGFKMMSKLSTNITATTTTTTTLGMLKFTRGFKSKSSLKKFCKDCYIVRRKGRVYVYCKSNGKHKQRQG